jgi:hypothetical protein
MFGGASGYFPWNDVWVLPLDGPANWAELITAGPRPSPRVRHSAIYDPIRNRLIVFGGTDESYNGYHAGRYFNDVWALSLDGVPTWTEIKPPYGELPAIRAGHSAVYDPVRDQMVIVGGYRKDPGAFGNYWWTVHDDTWFLPLSEGAVWQRALHAVLPPHTALYGTTAYDPLRDRVILINEAPDVWTLPLASSSLPYFYSQWIKIPATGHHDLGFSPAKWYAAYDATADRVLMAADFLRMSALTLDGDTLHWSPVTIYGPPQVRHDLDDSGMVFDPVRRRMMFAGGLMGVTPARVSGETFAAQIFPDQVGLVLTAHRPERGTVHRSPAKSCYSPGESVVISAIPTGDFVFDDWDGDANGRVNPMTIVMDRHKLIQAEFDRSTAVLLSQFDAVATESGVELRWRFADESRVAAARVEHASSANGPWSELALEARIREDVTIARDTPADVERPGFYRLAVTMRDGSVTRFGPIAPTVALSIRESVISHVSPNPSAGATRVQFTVARTGRVRLVLVDLAGRHVATLMDAESRAGRFMAEWDGMGDAGRVQPGAYFLKLSAGDQESVQRLMIVR